MQVKEVVQGVRLIVPALIPGGIQDVDPWGNPTPESEALQGLTKWANSIPILKKIRDLVGSNGSLAQAEALNGEDDDAEPGTIPTPEETQKEFDKHNQDIDKTIPTTAVPEPTPEQTQVEVKDTALSKTLKILGHLADLWDNISGG